MEDLSPKTRRRLRWSPDPVSLRDGLRSTPSFHALWRGAPLLGASPPQRRVSGYVRVPGTLDIEDPPGSGRWRTVGTSLGGAH